MKYDHTHCPPEAHDRDPGEYVEGHDDAPAVDEHGLMLCNDCGAPLLFCDTHEDYDHAEPDTLPCFLVHRSEAGR